ncbi:hypothetical protein MBEHAL_2252 [Halarchaeum acidiphilum MH1-52-1]|uniref:DUF7513 domain-containing protein n=1 Tax=Halarchaeum acidiphilum MH1-52-1 TaxID=1261545 RepID=U2YXH6_9EURY|nr:hypothetical protein [Halarchaeum acidiphilum]GAD53492.1 hypothetical protein MBEHAL_2252 [Halarchaeum acidiphilum MH1-52-1]
MNTEKLTAGWSFRTSAPGFDVDDELTVYVTASDGDVLARVGDTALTVHGAPAGVTEGTKIAVRVSDFDASTHTGDVEYLRTVGESTY